MRRETKIANLFSEWLVYGRADEYIGRRLVRYEARMIVEQVDKLGTKRVL